MKFIKKRGCSRTCYAKARGIEYEIRMSIGYYILYVQMKDGFTYSGFHYSGKTHKSLDKAIAFAEQIYSGDYDWQADVTAWEQREVEIKTAYENKMRAKANRFIGAVHEYGMSVDTFLELYEEFSYMDGEARVIVHESANDRCIAKEDKSNAE